MLEAVGYPASPPVAILFLNPLREVAILALRNKKKNF